MDVTNHILKSYTKVFIFSCPHDWGINFKWSNSPHDSIIMVPYSESKRRSLSVIKPIEIHHPISFTDDFHTEFLLLIEPGLQEAQVDTSLGLSSIVRMS